MTINLIPSPAATPSAERRVVVSTTQVARVVANWITGLAVDQGLVEPEAVSAYATRAHLWFRDDAALGTLLAWAEQLDAERLVDVRVDRFAETYHAVLVSGTVAGVEVLLHVVTRAALPDRPLVLSDLRSHVDADRATRATGDVPAVLPEGAPEQTAAEQ